MVHLRKSEHGIGVVLRIPYTGLKGMVIVMLQLSGSYFHLIVTARSLKKHKETLSPKPYKIELMFALLKLLHAILQKQP